MYFLFVGIHITIFAVPVTDNIPVASIDPFKEVFSFNRLIFVYPIDSRLTVFSVLVIVVANSNANAEVHKSRSTIAVANTYLFIINTSNIFFG